MTNIRYRGCVAHNGLRVYCDRCVQGAEQSAYQFAAYIAEDANAPSIAAAIKAHAAILRSRYNQCIYDDHGE